MVAALGNVMVVKGFPDGTAWLVGVGTIGETAVLGEMENLLEIACQFLRLHIEGAEALDARSINDIRGER